MHRQAQPGKLYTLFSSPLQPAHLRLAELASLQIWDQQGGSIVNAANGYCLSVAAVDCSHLGVCNIGMDQTGRTGTILSIVAEPCSASSPGLGRTWSRRSLCGSTCPQHSWPPRSPRSPPRAALISWRCAAAKSQLPVARCSASKALGIHADLRASAVVLVSLQVHCPTASEGVLGPCTRRQAVLRD